MYLGRFTAKSGRPHLSCISLVLFCATSIRHALSQSINSEANPWVLKFGASVGPDGPWNAIVHTVDYPDQNLTLLPSLTETSLFIESSACSGQDTVCPLQTTDMWTQTGAHSLFNWVNTTAFEASSWDTTVEPLRLQGSAITTTDRITLEAASRGSSFLDGLAITIASNYTVTFPSSDIYYTMDVGMLSLYADDNITWTSNNGSKVTYVPFLSQAYQIGSIPSISYGLHVGSVYPEISGSLIIGGYDRSRVLTSPITSSTNNFTLTDISLEVAVGGSPFSGLNSTNGLLESDGQKVGSLNVLANPGVPYLYLPGDTCNAIARFLPVTLDDSLGLYIWNTEDSAFENIVTSPSALRFSFQNNSTLANISVPFALLNLTLDSPLSSTSKQYFPCSPYTPVDNGMTYHLGRAFLQAAFLGQNWQTQKVFLTQAPGPQTKAEDVTTLVSTDSTLTAMANPPAWNDTWTSVLKAQPANSNTTTSGNPSQSTSDKNSSGLSGGAIAGIVVGVVAAVAIVGLGLFFLLRRRRKRERTPARGPVEKSAESDNATTDRPQANESASEPVYEVPSPLVAEKKHHVAAELDAPRYIGELEGSNV